MKTKQWIGLFLGFIVLLAVLLAAGSVPAAEADKFGGVLKVALSSGARGSIGVPWENALSPITTQHHSIDTLLKEQVDGSMKPGLAISYEISNAPDDSYIIFNLRKGVKFHDGSDFNASVAEWNLKNRWASPVSAATTQYWKSIEVLDPYTIKLNFKSWSNYMLRQFGDSIGYIISQASFEKNGLEWTRNNMVSTGPFIQKTFNRNVGTTFVRNPNYWDKPKPYLDGLELTYVRDDLTRMALFKSGGADVIDLNNKNNLAKELQDEGYEVIRQPHSGFFSLVPDSLNSDSPWSNRTVREAVSYAIDREALVDAFGFGFEKVAYQYYPESSPAHDPTIVPRKYNPEKAKKLLGQAGYPDGFQTTMTVAPNASRDIAQAMQAQLAEIGIKVDLKFPQIGAWIKQVTGTWNQGVQFMTQSLWPNPNANWNFFVAEPHNWFKSLKHPPGWKEVLFASFETKMPDPKAMRKLSHMLHDDVTFIPLMYHEGTYAVQKWVHDTGYGTRGMWTWWNVADTWMSKKK